MVNRPAPGLLLGVGDEARLERLVRSESAPAGLVTRARIVLLAGEGTPNQQIAATVGVSRPTVNLWRFSPAMPSRG